MAILLAGWREHFHIRKAVFVLRVIGQPRAHPHRVHERFGEPLQHRIAGQPHHVVDVDFIQELEQPRAGRAFGLFGNGHVPVLGARQALLDETRRRSGVRGIASGHHEGRNIQPQKVLRLGGARGAGG